ncbi:MAG: MBL fold metallo-hydrolase [Cyclobacteriaceae bacterium]
MRTRTLPLLVAILMVSSLASQSIEVTRSAYLKHKPERNSEYFRKMEPGDVLTLLKTEKENGYYFAQYRNFKGYVYKSFVKATDEQGPSPTVVDGALEIYILDTGAGLCSVARTPNDKYIVYDAGHWTPKGFSYQKISSIIKEGSDIELMVLSHTDGDHISAAAEVIRNYNVKKLLDTGFERSHVGENQRAGYRNVLNAVRDNPRTKHINLHERDSIITPGNSLTIDGVKATFLCGFGEPLREWIPSFEMNNSPDWRIKSLKINGVSIVMKLSFSGVNILFCGDAVGRRIGGSSDQLIGTEKWLMDNARQYLKSDIIVAPHHGADNGSSTAFIGAVGPETVIFSAGSEHDHPTKGAAKRYLKAVDINNIYRTDRGDNEGGFEWENNSSGCEDPKGDDDILVKIESGTYSVSYMNPNASCPDE